MSHRFSSSSTWKAECTPEATETGFAEGIQPEDLVAIDEPLSAGDRFLAHAAQRGLTDDPPPPDDLPL